MRITPIPDNDAPKPLAFYSPGAVVGDVVYLAGQIASDYLTGVPPEARRSPDSSASSDIREQVEYVLGNLRTVARAAGADIDSAVSANVFLKDAGDRAGFDEAWRGVFGPSSPPVTVSTVGGHGLLVPGTVVEVDLWAAPVGQSGPRDAEVPGQARRLGHLVHCAAQTSTDDAGDLLPEAVVRPEFPFYAEPVERQTRALLAKVERMLGSWGGRLEHVVWARAFLTDLSDVDLFDEVWQELVPHRPARTILHSDELAGDGVLVQVEVIAVAPESRDLVRPVFASWAPEGAASAVVVGDVVLLSGVSGVRDPSDCSPLRSDVAAQTESLLSRMQDVLRAAGTDLSHLVKTQVFLSDLDLFHRYDRTWKRSLTHLPPRTTTQTGSAGFLDPAALLTIDAVAVLP
jgi:enamine deaminase RidA (YjgF/YER057c/UK114 family)